MRKLYNQLMNAEPARLINTTAAILVILTNVAAYFVPQINEAVALIITGAILAISGELTRGNVYAPKTYEALKKEQNYSN